MNSEEKKTLNKIINYIQKNEDDKALQFLDDDLFKCELRINKYPNADTRASNKIAVSYTFKTNDKDSLDDLLFRKNTLAELSQDLLDDDYELALDEDNEPIIDIKFVDDELDCIQSAPKITFEKCIDVVINSIESAQISIVGAVAWLTNKKILDTLIKKANEGVLISFISDNNSTNTNFRKNNQQYTFLPFPITYVTNMAEDYWKGQALMHLKFCVIDNKKVLYGTFNWSDAACFNDEDIHEDCNSSSVQDYIKKYTDLCKKYNALFLYGIRVDGTMLN